MRKNSYGNIEMLQAKENASKIKNLILPRFFFGRGCQWFPFINIFFSKILTLVIVFYFFNNWFVDSWLIVIILLFTLVFWFTEFRILLSARYRVPGFATGFQSYFLYSAQAAQTQHGSAWVSAQMLSQTQCLSSAEWFVRWWGLRHLHFLILISFLHLCQLSFLKF